MRRVFRKCGFVGPWIVFKARSVNPSRCLNKQEEEDPQTRNPEILENRKQKLLFFYCFS